MDSRIPPLRRIQPKLKRFGYFPIPIQPGSKAPPLKCINWQDPSVNWSSYVQMHNWTGLLTFANPAIDLDVRDKQVVKSLIKLADEVLGKAPTRVGASPKTLLLYQTTEFFNKMSSRPFCLPDDPISDPKWSPHKIEILANGQQFVAYAIHPGTKEPYRWGRGEPLTVPARKLPIIEDATVAQSWLSAAETLLETEHRAIFVRRKSNQWTIDERPIGGEQERTWSVGERQRGNPDYWWCFDTDPENIVEALNLRRYRNSWVGRCPVHGSYSGKPSSRSDVFQIKVGFDNSIVFICFAGCDPDEIAEEVSVKLERIAQSHILNTKVPYDYGEYGDMGREDLE